MEQLTAALGTDFEIVRPLGDGAVSEVFMAREKALERPVAVKVLRARLSVDETARKRFVREARLAAKIHHPGVVEVYRVGELDDGRPYLVMEYIDGRTFEDILAASGPLAEDEAVNVLSAVCGALEAAHKLGIIHRDVRPGNIMRTREGDRIVLADFGLAGILETGGEAVTRLTQAGQVLGNVQYAPPEQLDGQSVQPGSDIYALAVTAYELLTGKTPFPEARKPADVIKAHLLEEPVPIGKIRPGISAGLEDTLLRCLQKRPEHRPDAGLLRRRLDGTAESEMAAGTALGSFLAELRRRHVYKVGAAYGAFLLVVLAVVDVVPSALPFLPDWIDTAIVAITLAGFPVALVLGWLFDLSGGAVQRTASLTSDTPRGMRMLQVGGILLALAVAAALAWLFVW